MKAKVTKAFRGAKDGEHHPTQFKPGDTVEGKLAEVAVSEGWARAGRSKPEGEPAAEDAASVPAEAPQSEGNGEAGEVAGEGAAAS